ncbi:MAG: 2-oxoglutarate dehydrogenase E1 component [Hyphomicrobiaceae bacterium]
MRREAMNEAFLQSSFLHGANSAYVEDLYVRFKSDPASVEPGWQAFFRAMDEEAASTANGAAGPSWSRPDLMPAANDDLEFDLPAAAGASLARHVGETRERGEALSAAAAHLATRDTIAALTLIRSYRVRGHLAADLDPLGLAEPGDHPELRPATYGFKEEDLDRQIFIDTMLGPDNPVLTMRQIVEIMRLTYCGKVGVEYMHIAAIEERRWIQRRIESREKWIRFTKEGKKAILRKLIEAESFERFLHVKYTGTKRFGLEGAEAMVPALEQIIKRGSQEGVHEIVIGMPHRGRLNVLANVMAKPFRAIFNEFRGGSSNPDDVEGSGDVKYHLGASSDRALGGDSVHLSLTANPSHLEIVDPVVLGKVRAKQDQRGGQKFRTEVLPLILHGDAAFAGQGVVAECFGLSGLKGHRTGGSIHFIVNNQIGFTTSPRSARSSPYPSDVARMVQAPIFHVNGDDPEAVTYVAKVAAEFRQKFRKPVVIDMFCYRRHGHNESDEPSFTQPLMYRRIRDHKTVVALYTEELVGEGLISAEDAKAMETGFLDLLDNEMKVADTYKPNRADWLDGRWKDMSLPEAGDRRGDTAVGLDNLRQVGKALTTFPRDFNLHRTLERLVKRRAEMIETGEGIDWATAEQLALGTLLLEGRAVRFSGQDVERGTFSQRHAVFIDQESEKRWTPLKHVGPEQGRFEIINSMLSEEAVLGFEYGYSLAEPNALVLWEAQFGDFANGAQVVIDQFICSGERKWLRMSGLVMLLPHGYEGQGPEHSSARLERYLQLSAEDNWQIANCTTPANYFHILRRQLHRKFRKPLVLMTPKSLLRHKRVVSRMEDLGPGSTFHRVLWDDADTARLGERAVGALKSDAEIRRVVLCSGKVYYDLVETRDAERIDDVYVMRLEQLYPVPDEALVAELKRFPKADLVWCQEEPRNMGAWSFIEPYLEALLGRVEMRAKRPVYAGRDAAASTATGLLKKHNAQQAALVAAALGMEKA